MKFLTFRVIVAGLAETLAKIPVMLANVAVGRAVLREKTAARCRKKALFFVAATFAI